MLFELPATSVTALTFPDNLEAIEISIAVGLRESPAP